MPTSEKWLKIVSSAIQFQLNNMGNTQPSKLIDSNSIVNISFLEDGHFAKIYKGQFAHNNQFVTVKVPRAHESVRKEKSEFEGSLSSHELDDMFFHYVYLELVKTHVEEVKKLVPNIKRARNDYIVKYLGVAYDDFRKEVWVRHDQVTF